MNGKKGFTLIELMISITILVILTMVSYAPYSYYQNKASLKITTREVSQLLYESRNMAINGAIDNNSNVSIGVYFDTNSISNNIVKVFSYPHDVNTLNILNNEGGDVKLLKTLILKKGIAIDYLHGNPNILFFFNSITGELTYYSWNGYTRNRIEDDQISINFSFKGSTSPNLNRTINYFTNTNIIDY